MWNLQPFPASRLKAVLVYGHHGQAVAGPHRAVIVRFSTSKGGDAACGPPAYGYEGGRSRERLDATIRARIGRGIESFRGTYAASGFDIDHGRPVGPGLASVAITSLRTSEPFEAGQLAGTAGLRALVDAGVIRRATVSDIDKFSAALTRASTTGHLAPVKAKLDVRNTHVVLKPMVAPRGMYGANSATFLVPAAVPRPIDHESHNGYASLADGSKWGSIRGRD